MTTATVAATHPFPVNVEQGKDYYWCSCGLSKSQPLCDGSHKGSAFTPKKFTADKSATVYMCGCKQSKNGVLCDGAHKSVTV